MLSESTKMRAAFEKSEVLPKQIQSVHSSRLTNTQVQKIIINLDKVKKKPSIGREKFIGKPELIQNNNHDIFTTGESTTFTGEDSEPVKYNPWT